MYDDQTTISFSDYGDLNDALDDLVIKPGTYDFIVTNVKRVDPGGEGSYESQKTAFLAVELTINSTDPRLNGRVINHKLYLEKSGDTASARAGKATRMKQFLRCFGLPTANIKWDQWLNATGKANVVNATTKRGAKMASIADDNGFLPKR